jgi:uncharacterized protein YbbC (DUF1343 family)
MIRSLFLLSFLSFFLFGSCQHQHDDQSMLLGANRTDLYFSEIEGRSIGLLVNHTSIVDDMHLVDFLLSKGMDIHTIFAPEHGFRGTADAGEHVKDGEDKKTGIPIVSLYGNNKKPTPGQLEGIDAVIFDIQDVGVRFYTYISTMHLMMEACAATGTKMIILDRPNPNGHLVDGPVLQKEFSSFVGMHAIPVLHGLTVGELAKMINEEGWLQDTATCDLMVVPMRNYRHSIRYLLPVRPSPNLPNEQAVMLYPSLCFFEGTQMSIGRGTQFPFQVIGYPDSHFGRFTFTPVSIEGMSKNPKYENQRCYGVDLRTVSAPDKLDVGFVIDFYRKWEKKDDFFTEYFDTLAGTDALRMQILQGKTEIEIRATWQPALQQYKALRKKYLLYNE